MTASAANRILTDITRVEAHRNYDGSWTEQTNLVDAPIEKG